MFSWHLTVLIIGFIEIPILRSADHQDSDIYTIPDYDFRYSDRPNLRRRLLEKLAMRNQNDEKVRKLKESISKDTEYYDDIPHHKVESTPKLKRKAVEFEDEYKKIIGMAEVTYTYKRDLYWRTWREVKHSNKSKNVVCYRCENVINCNHTNYTDCHNGGYWAIEDGPPTCSFDVLSFKSEKLLCVVNFWNINERNLSACPNKITYGELSYCYFPMITKLRITRDYSKKVSKRYQSVICKERGICEFSTFYSITPEIIVFRIINSSNDIIFSRLMKNDGNNYVCIQDCGHIDLDTMKVTKNEDHLILNLLKNYPQKAKRENSLHYNIYHKNVGLNQMTPSKNNLFAKRHKYILEQPLSGEKYYPITTTLSYCKRIILKELANINDN